MGGGRTYLPNSVNDPEYASTKGRRLDGRNLTAEWLFSRGATGSAALRLEPGAVRRRGPAATRYLLGLFRGPACGTRPTRQPTARGGATQPR